jgi:hypothetical protein
VPKLRWLLPTLPGKACQEIPARRSLPGKACQEKPARNKHSCSFCSFISYKENKMLRIQPRDCIHTTSFSSGLTNGPKKLGCCITLCWKGLPVTNTGILGPFVSYEEKYSVENKAPGAIFRALYFLGNLKISPIS